MTRYRSRMGRILGDEEMARLAAEDQNWAGAGFTRPGPEDDPAPEQYEHVMRQPCGCPMDADCTGYHPGALGSASGFDEFESRRRHG